MSASELLGYDPSLLRRLAVGHRAAIDWLAACWLLSCGLLACPIAYATWLVVHSAWIAAAVGCGCLGLVLAVLRLTIAGGGAPLHHSVHAYAPSAGPAVLIAVLALLFAQPAQLPLLHGELAAPLAQHRRALLERHDASARHAGLPVSDNYARELSRCEFVALRLQHVWHTPGRAVRYTLLYCLLVLFPSLLARTGARDPLRRYERLRVEGHRRVVRRSAAAARAELHTLLAPYPSYNAGSGESLDPFQAAEPNPLRTPANPGPRP